MKPLNVREWLQARRLEGCEYADQLLDLVEVLERENLLDVRDLKRALYDRPLPDDC